MEAVNGTVCLPGLYVHASVYLEWVVSMRSAAARLLGEPEIVCDVFKIYMEMILLEMEMVV